MFRILYKFNRNKAVLTNRIRTCLPALPLIAASVALVLGTSSCYTLLKHPHVAQADYEEDPMEVGCLSCHTDHDIWAPGPRPPRRPPWWLDHDWGNELETVPIRDGFRPIPGKIIDDDPPVKIPLDPPGVKIPPGGTVKSKEDSDGRSDKAKENDSKERTLRPKEKKKKKKKEDG